MRARLLVIGIVLIALHAAGALAPRLAFCDPLFAVEGYRAIGIVPPSIAAFVLLVILVSDRVARILGPGRPIPLPLLILGFGTAFVVLTNHTLSGDAGSVLRRLCLREVYPSNALTNWIWHVVADITTISARETIRFVAVAAGLVYVAAAVGIGRQCFEDLPRRDIVTILLLTAGTMGLFFGTLEVYAPLAAGIAVYVWLGLREIRDPSRRPWSAFVLGITFCLHGSAGLLLPSQLLFTRRSLLVRGMLFLLPVLVVAGSLFFGTWGGQLPNAGPARTGTFLGAMGQGPLLPLLLSPTNVLHRYAILDADHLLGVANLWLMAAPVGLLLLVTGRWPRRDPIFRFVLVVGAFLALFPVFWNVSYPLRRDWDLFSTVGIPLAVLGGLTLGNRTVTRIEVNRIVALALFAFVPFLLTLNGSDRDRRRYADRVSLVYRSVGDDAAADRWRERGEKEARETFERAMLAARRGDLPQAEALLREILAAAPDDAVARETLGAILLSAGRTEEGRAELWTTVRNDPGRVGAWLRLADLEIREGDRDEAIRLLTRGIRAGTATELAAPALLELARLREERGDVEIAAELRRLAATRGAD
jgi:hypothetical protein